MTSKKATNVDDQINLLRSRGMSIDDESKSKEILLDIGYYRLGFYCFPFEISYPQKENRTHEYKDQTTFMDVVDLYYFDFELRNILLKYLSRIEINFRTHVTYLVSNHYPHSETWFVDDNIVNNSFISVFDEKIYNSNFKKNTFIKLHHKNHPSDKYAPAWKTIELMTFGSVIKLYSAIKDIKIQLEISRSYKVNKLQIFINYLNTLCTLRNICAHGSVIYDLKLNQSIKSGPALKISQDNERNNLYGAIKIIEFILNTISINRKNDFVAELEAIKGKYMKKKILNDIIENCSGLKYK